MFTTLQEYFSDKARWTCGVSWRDKNGDACRLKEAACACLYGAIDIVYPDRNEEIAEKLREAGKRLFLTDALTGINDRMGYDAVVRLVKEANV